MFFSTISQFPGCLISCDLMVLSNQCYGQNCSWIQQHKGVLSRLRKLFSAESIPYRLCILAKCRCYVKTGMEIEEHLPLKTPALLGPGSAYSCINDPLVQMWLQHAGIFCSGLFYFSWTSVRICRPLSVKYIVCSSLYLYMNIYCIKSGEVSLYCFRF